MSADTPVTWWRITVLRDRIVPVEVLRETKLLVVGRTQPNVLGTRWHKGVDVFPSFAAAVAHERDRRTKAVQDARWHLVRAEAALAALDTWRPPEETR